jgi:hypothetical protein
MNPVAGRMGSPIHLASEIWGTWKKVSPTVYNVFGEIREVDTETTGRKGFHSISDRLDLGIGYGFRLRDTANSKRVLNELRLENRSAIETTEVKGI